MAPPIVTATLQSAVLGATSNILAQAITAYRNETPFTIDWVPVFQFLLFTAVSTPPNFLWQEYLEATFPATHIEPTKTAIASAAADDDKALDAKARRGQLVEPKLNVRNTVTKFLLDQTVGSTVNTLLFSMFMTSIQLAMAPGVPGGKTGAAAIDYGRVDWAFVLAKSRAEFWSIIKAGWRLWPAVSLVNFTLVKSVQGRNLLGSLAGVVWGIYMSLFAAA